jgi:non-specific serine/threonine protein kinase
MTWARKNADDLGLSLALDFHLRDMTQARALLEEVLAHSPTGGALRAEALGKAAFLAWAQGDYEAAFQAAEPSVSLRREQGDLEALVNALNLLGMAQQGRGRLAAAAAVYEEASALLKNSTSRTWMTIRNSLGMVAVDSGDYIAASEILTEIVDVARAQRDLWLYSGYLDSLAHAQLGLEDYNAAAASWKEVLKISRDLAEDLTIFLSLEGLGCVAGVTGDDRRALRLAAAANRMARSRSLSADAWLSRRVEESEHRSRGRLGAPKGEEAWNQGWAMTVEQAIDYALSDTEPQGVSDSGLLSRRQQDVVKLVAQGMTNRQIAERLFIAERSAEGHLESWASARARKLRSGRWRMALQWAPMRLARKAANGRGTHTGPSLLNGETPRGSDARCGGEWSRRLLCPPEYAAGRTELRQPSGRRLRSGGRVS